MIKICKLLVSCSPKKRNSCKCLRDLLKCNPYQIFIYLFKFYYYYFSLPLWSLDQWLQGELLRAPCLSRYAPNLPSANRQPQIIEANLLYEVQLGLIVGPFQSQLSDLPPWSCPKEEQWKMAYCFFTYPILRGPLKLKRLYTHWILYPPIHTYRFIKLKYIQRPKESRTYSGEFLDILIIFKLLNLNKLKWIKVNWWEWCDSSF